MDGVRRSRVTTPWAHRCSRKDMPIELVNLGSMRFGDIFPDFQA